ncbi:MAG: YitT family protein [Lachnospiraceae bacterium]|nr:YitT family protein [Lachnospiraceae bacterium]
MKDRKTEIIRTAWILVGALLYTAGLIVFVNPMHLYSGGAMGVSQLTRTLLADKAGIDFGTLDISGIIYYVLNVPLFVIAYRKLSKQFFFKTLFAVSLVTLLLAVIPSPEPFIENKLTGCIIGGMTVGAGVGIMLRAGGSGGGLDIVGMYFAKHKRNMSVGRVSLCINIFIYILSAILFDVETAVYSVIMSAVTAIMLDRVHYQNIMMQAVIITKVDGLAAHIMENTHRGVTEWTGDGAYTNEGVHILLTVISKYEMTAVKRVIHEYDPHAFVSYTHIEALDGNFKKRLT